MAWREDIGTTAAELTYGTLYKIPREFLTPPDRHFGSEACEKSPQSLPGTVTNVDVQARNGEYVRFHETGIVLTRPGEE
uniref:Uncharacterized protein n=1 Tax=Bracon brevicornis TaxID=1563983 RepID=A0A6V7JFU5_9HYME